MEVHEILIQFSEDYSVALYILSKKYRLICYDVLLVSFVKEKAFPVSLKGYSMMVALIVEKGS